MVFVHDGNTLLMSKPTRGWGLPGGHVEGEESTRQCAEREVYEEAAVQVANLKLVGGWKAQKIRDTDSNKKYPATAYQLLYVARVKQVDKFTPQHESTDRGFFAFDKVPKYHHNFEPFAEIFRYVTDVIEKGDA